MQRADGSIRLGPKWEHDSEQPKFGVLLLVFDIISMIFFLEIKAFRNNYF